MSKRKSDNEKVGEDRDNNNNCWTKFERDCKGLIKDLYIRQLREDDDDEEEQNGHREDGKDQQHDNGTKAPTDFEPSIQKLAFFQGKSWSPYKKRLPIPRGVPASEVTGFRSIILHGMAEWEGGIDKEVVDFLAQASPLLSRDEAGDTKFRLSINLPFAFKGNQAANFGKNLDELLSIPCIEDSIGALSYSEGGHLAEMLARFQKLDPNPKFLYRYDIHVYAENDTLVEDYFGDLEHWLSTQWAQPPPTGSEIVRQARLKFVWERGDTAEQMLDLIKESFQKASNPYSDRHSFVIRLDCPGFTLEPFHIENNKSSEIMALEFKEEKTLKGDTAIEDFEAEEEEPEAKKGKTTTKEGGNNDGIIANGNNNNEEEEETTVWRSYKLVRAKDGNELEKLMAGQLPVIRRTLSIVQ